MSEEGTLHDAFIEELKGTYDAEKQLIKALPKLAKAATSPQLRQAFESHLAETQTQVTRLEKVFRALGEPVKGKHCDGIAGIIEEGKSIMEEEFDEATMDACLVAAGQRAEHYELAAYGSLIAWAQDGYDQSPSSSSRPDEENAADKKPPSPSRGRDQPRGGQGARSENQMAMTGNGGRAESTTELCR
jgi:ferritin-like metal-binding protein YciE